MFFLIWIQNRRPIEENAMYLWSDSSSLSLCTIKTWISLIHIQVWHVKFWVRFDKQHQQGIFEQDQNQTAYSVSLDARQAGSSWESTSSLWHKIWDDAQCTVKVKKKKKYLKFKIVINE